MNYHTMGQINIGVWVIAAVIYFFPTLLAMVRKGATVVVFLVNLLTGWTLIGWLAALLLACC